MDGRLAPPLLVGVDDVVRGHLSVTLMKLDPLSDIVSPGGEVVGDAPGLYQHRHGLPVFVEADQAVRRYGAEDEYGGITRN